MRMPFVKEWPLSPYLSQRKNPVPSAVWLYCVSVVCTAITLCSELQGVAVFGLFRSGSGADQQQSEQHILDRRLLNRKYSRFIRAS
jgi:hypothetical protein